MLCEIMTLIQSIAALLKKALHERIYRVLRSCACTYDGSGACTTEQFSVYFLLNLTQKFASGGPYAGSALRGPSASPHVAAGVIITLLCSVYSPCCTTMDGLCVVVCDHRTCVSLGLEESARTGGVLDVDG